MSDILNKQDALYEIQENFYIEKCSHIRVFSENCKNVLDNALFFNKSSAIDFLSSQPDDRNFKIF